MNDILTKINMLSKNDDKTLYHFISEQLNHESNDIGFWLSLAIAIFYPPFGDEEKSISFLNKALAIDNNNPFALIILAYVYHHHLGGIDDMRLHQIKNVFVDSNEINSMLKYAASWSYSYTKKQHYDLEEELLKESILLCDKHVWNYVSLAELYLQEKRYLEVNNLIRKALRNIQKIYSYKNIDEYTTTSIDDFINSLIKGTHLTDSNVESIEKKLVPRHIIFFYTIVTPLLNIYNFIKKAILRSMNFKE